jgi:hypothetical protein
MVCLFCEAFAQPLPLEKKPAAASVTTTTLSVVAGVDRVVVLPGKTYLNGWAGYADQERRGRRGRRRGPEAPPAPAPVGPAPTVSWSKESGPGQVTFADEKAVVTTATFSAPGDYVLKLTAKTDQATTSSTLNVTATLPPPAKQLEAVNTKAFK